MEILLAAEGLTSSAPWWAVVVAALFSGGGGLLVAVWQARKLLPAQVRQTDALAQKEAVETVREALAAARARVDSLEVQVRENLHQSGALAGQLQHEQSDRQRISDQLNLALVERAKLQQQMIDLNRILGTRRLQDDLGESVVDAIVIVSLNDGRISYANEGVFTLLGYMPTTLIGERLSVLIPEGLRKHHEGKTALYATNPHTRPMGVGLDLRARHLNGSTIPVEISLHPTGDGRVLALIKRRPADRPVAASSGPLEPELAASPNEPSLVGSQWEAAP